MNPYRSSQAWEDKFAADLAEKLGCDQALIFPTQIGDTRINTPQDMNLGALIAHGCFFGF